MTRIGLISDTHGLLRPEALAFLKGCDHIVHGGDIGGPEVLARLGAIAPLTAVRGNNDHQPWADAVPDTDMVQVGGIFIYALHILEDLDIDPAAVGVQVVLTGHSHRPKMETRNGVLYINPGSAGPRRFSLPISIGELMVGKDGSIQPRIVDLETSRDARVAR